MADFSININANLVAPYTRLLTYKTYDICSPKDLSFTVALLEGTPSSNKVSLLSTLSGIALKTLHIDNVTFSNSSKLWIAYNGTILNAGSNNIDITGLSYTDLIPLLSVELLTSIAIADTINFDISITDINNIRYPAVRSRIAISVEECPAPADPAFLGTVDTVANTHCTNGQTKAFSVTAAAYSNIRFRYTLIDNGNHGFNGSLYQTDTKNGNDILFISGITSAMTSPTDIIVNMGSSTTKHFRICVEARPPIDPADNIIACQLALRNTVNTGDIGIIVMTDTNPF